MYLSQVTEVNRAVLTARGILWAMRETISWARKQLPQVFIKAIPGYALFCFPDRTSSRISDNCTASRFLLTLANYEKTRMKVSASLQASVQFGDGKTRRERKKTLTFSEILLLFLLPHSDNTHRRGRGEQGQIAVMFKYVLWNVAVSKRTAHRTATQNPTLLLRSKSRLSTNQQSHD